MTYRHVTNLKVPLDIVDLAFLGVLPDYRFGQPVMGSAPTAWPTTELTAKGYVGLYTTREALSAEMVKRKTGWNNPDNLLGTEWVPQ